MFKINTFLVKFCNGEERYISLDDSFKLREVFEHRKFTPEYIQLHITIQYNDQIVVGNDIPSGLDLWRTTYITAVESYLDEQKVEIMYGINPITLKIDSIDNNLLDFQIIGEWKPNVTLAKAFLPQKEFLKALLDEAEQFWNVLLEYKVFEGKAKRETTPSNYPVQMIKEVKQLRDRVKLLN